MKKVTAEEWADHLVHYSCYATELTPHTLDHIHHETKEHVAQVVYKPEHGYYINTDLKARPIWMTEEDFIFEDMVGRLFRIRKNEQSQYWLYRLPDFCYRHGFDFADKKSMADIKWITHKEVYLSDVKMAYNFKVPETAAEQFAFGVPLKNSQKGA